jgi:hypothetical protein
MTAILAQVNKYLDSNDINGAREKIVNNFLNLKLVDSSVLNFAILLTCGSQRALEVGLGVLSRKLIDNDMEINESIVWLFLAAILSRTNITPDSPSRISILGLISCVKNWESPVFALLAPALDAFFKISISANSSLVAEQTIDFLATWGDNYAKAPHSRINLNQLKSLTQSVLDQVDDLDLKLEWTEGRDSFYEKAYNIKYSDENIWSASGNLLKEIFSSQVLSRDTAENCYNLIKSNISRLITSSLATIKTILGGNGLSIAVHIDNLRDKNLWSVGANVIDKLEQLLQEIADETFDRIIQLPSFAPPQSILGSWTIILKMPLTDLQSNLLARAIKDIASVSDSTNEIDSLILDSWRECVARLKEDNLRVDLAVSTNDSEFLTIRSISTEDVPNVDELTVCKVRVLSHNVPQANKLERILDFADLLVQYPSSLSTVRRKFSEIDGIGNRSFSYYRRAIQILGLADDRCQPTISCKVLKRLPTQEAKIRFLAYQFISSKVGSAWLDWQNVNDLSEIEPDNTSEFLAAVCPSIAESTVSRRVNTLKSWINMFKQYYSN